MVGFLRYIGLFFQGLSLEYCLNWGIGGSGSLSRWFIGAGAEDELRQTSRCDFSGDAVFGILGVVSMFLLVLWFVRIILYVGFYK